MLLIESARWGWKTEVVGELQIAMLLTGVKYFSMICDVVGNRGRKSVLQVGGVCQVVTRLASENFLRVLDHVF